MIEFGQQERTIAEDDDFEGVACNLLLLERDRHRDKRSISKTGEEDCGSIREGGEENRANEIGSREGLSRANGKVGKR